MSLCTGREEGSKRCAMSLRTSLGLPLLLPVLLEVSTARQTWDRLLLTGLCFAGQSWLSKASTDVLTSGTDVANSCEVLFGRDSGGTPKGAGSPFSFTPPHTFFRVPDTNVHPNTALSFSGVSYPLHQRGAGQSQPSGQPAAKQL